MNAGISCPASISVFSRRASPRSVSTIIAANSSTILTHLNWGASYLVHDFYQRFIRKNAPEKHYVMVGRLATVGLFLLSSATVYLLDSAKDAFDVILQIGAGTGLLRSRRPRPSPRDCLTGFRSA